MGGAFWDAGAEVFINKGTNGRWKETLTDEDNRRYKSKAIDGP
jgi:aryl sulfotransferase